MTYLKMRIWLVTDHTNYAAFNFRNNKFKLCSKSLPSFLFFVSPQFQFLWEFLSDIIKSFAADGTQHNLNENSENDSIDIIVCLLYFFPAIILNLFTFYEFKAEEEKQNILLLCRKNHGNYKNFIASFNGTLIAAKALNWRGEY